MPFGNEITSSAEADKIYMGVNNEEGIINELSLLATTTQLIERRLSYSRQPFREVLLVSPWISVASDVRDCSQQPRNAENPGYC